jgi:hypothetical protein
MHTRFISHRTKGRSKDISFPFSRNQFPRSLTTSSFNMNLTGKNILRFLLISALASSCVEPYYPSETLNAPDIIVIDGSINTTGQSARVTITHAYQLTDPGPGAPEPGASVSIEAFGGGVFPLSEKNAGVYQGSGLPFDVSEKYRLYVQTRNGKRYQSEYIQLLQSPPIDSVVWTPKEENIEIAVNTHDDTGKSKFYMWRFEETWKYTAPYHSSFTFEDGEVVPTAFKDQTYICYRSTPSLEILVGSTNQLTQDIVRNFVVAKIPAHSRKIAYRYSILVKQTVLSEEAYSYWHLLQRTTENLGGMFDPMPGQVLGNIKCITDTSEPVLGYFSGGADSEKRIFIAANEVPFSLRYIPSESFCQIDSVLFDDMPTEGNNIHIISTYGIPLPLGYTLTTRDCTDCRTQGGQLEVPEFWEE